MYIVLAFLFTLLVAIFAVQNHSPVTVRFLPWQFETSVAIIVLGSATVGAIIVGLRGLFMQIGLNLRISGYRGRIRQLETELKSLKEREMERRQELEKWEKEMQPSTQVEPGEPGKPA